MLAPHSFYLQHGLDDELDASKSSNGSALVYVPTHEHKSESVSLCLDELP